MCSFEYERMLKEFNPLINTRLKAVKEYTDFFIFRFEFKEVIVRLPYSMNIKSFETHESFDEKRTNNFVVFLKKVLINRRLSSIEKIDSERIIKFQFGDWELFFEMFSKGNMILVKDNIISACLFDKKWKARTIQKGQPYILPPSFNVSDLSFDNIKSDKKAYIISKLSHLKYGPFYAKICIYELNIPEKTPCSNIDENLFNKIKSFYTKLENSEEYYYYSQQDLAHTYSLIDSDFFSNYNKKQFDSLSQAIDYYHINNRKEDEQYLKQKRIVLARKQKLEEIDKKQEFLKKQIETIYSNYNKLNLLLSYLKKINPREADKQNLEKKFNIKLDLKNKRFEIDI